MIEAHRSNQAGLPAKFEKAPAWPANLGNLIDALRPRIERDKIAAVVLTSFGVTHSPGSNISW